MKTAISIPDEVFQDAERLARALKKSRSQLYSLAVKEYVARHSEDDVTSALDRVYAEGHQAEAELPRAAAERTLAKTDW